MKKCIVLFFVVIPCLIWASEGDSVRTYNDLHNQIYQLQNQNLDDKKESTQAQIDLHGKRVEDLHHKQTIFLSELTIIVSFFAIFITVSIAFASYYLNRKSKSLREDFNTQKGIIDNNLKLLDLHIEQAKEKADIAVKEIEEKNKNASKSLREDFNAQKEIVNAKLDLHIQQANIEKNKNALELLIEIENQQTKSLEINPKYPNAYRHWGNSYLALKEYEKAIEKYTTAISIKPEYIEVFEDWHKALDEIKTKAPMLYTGKVNEFKKVLLRNKELENNQIFQKIYTFYFDS